MSRKSKSRKIPDFIPLYGRDNKLNFDLVDITLTNEGKFYVKDVYGVIFRIDEKTYKLLREE